MKIRNYFYILLLLFFLCEVSYSQVFYDSKELPETAALDSVLFKILRVELVGNNITKDYILFRELHFDAADVVSLKEIFLARKRILNLFLFNRVIFDLVGDEDALIVLITVVERWYFFPLPILYLNDRSWSKVSYGAKILYYNFTGRNILLNCTAAFGYNPEFKLCFRNPWFGGKLKLLTNLVIFNKRIISKTLKYEKTEDQRIGFDWTIGRRIGHYFYLSANIGYMELSHPDITVNSNGKDKLPGFSLSFKYDNRDLKEYPHCGKNITFWGKHVRYDDKINYFRYGMDLRTYWPVSTYSTLAIRGAVNLSYRTVPLYDRTFIGYSERIRGKFHQKYEGENIVIGGLEFRFPIKKIIYIDLSEFAPTGFESYYSNLKFGISAGIFYDYGTVWYQNQSLTTDDLLYGFGAGLHFHLPYVEIFRLEMGFNEDLNHEFIAEVGVTF